MTKVKENKEFNYKDRMKETDKIVDECLNNPTIENLELLWRNGKDDGSDGLRNSFHLIPKLFRTYEYEGIPTYSKHNKRLTTEILRGRLSEDTDYDLQKMFDMLNLVNIGLNNQMSLIDIENLVGRKLSESELKMIPVLIESSIKDDVKIQRHVGEWIQNNIFNYITYQLDRELKKLETDL